MRSLPWGLSKHNAEVSPRQHPLPISSSPLPPRSLRNGHEEQPVLRQRRFVPSSGKGQVLEEKLLGLARHSGRNCQAKAARAAMRVPESAHTHACTPLYSRA